MLFPAQNQRSSRQAIKVRQTPAEVKRYSFDFTGALDEGETIITLAYASQLANRAADCASPVAITVGDGQIEEGALIVFFFVSAGSDGCTYKASLIVTTSAGQTLENTISVQVKAP